MQKLKILRQILVRTHVNQMLITYFIFIFAVAAIITLAEPGIHTYREAIWYCYACVTTIGFGDVVVVTAISRILSIILSIYSVLIIAIVTGVVVNFYNQMIRLRQEETLTAFLDKLEHLPELSKDELEQLSEKVAEFQKKRRF